MSSIDGWNNFGEKLKIVEEDGKFYIENCPNDLYNTREEVAEVIERLKDAVLF